MAELIAIRLPLPMTASRLVNEFGFKVLMEEDEV